MQDVLLKIQEKLQRTMVFITHDFLEAIKMGDHIAIMKDGEVSQVGTPEEIVANPKEQYVKDFCEDVPKYKVLSAGKVMRKECCDETKNLYSKKIKQFYTLMKVFCQKKKLLGQLGIIIQQNQHLEKMRFRLVI